VIDFSSITFMLSRTYKWNHV